MDIVKGWKKKKVLGKKFLSATIQIKSKPCFEEKRMSKVFTLCSAAAVLAATGAFAQMSRSSNKSANTNPCQCMEQGMCLPSDAKCFPAAYNAPASIAVSCGWDFNIFGSFIYWHTSEEGLDLAYVGPVAGTSEGTVVLPGAVAYQDFTYKPGFQVGVGFNLNHDDWVGWLEYTWLHQSETTSAAAPALASGSAGSWSSSDWFPSTAFSGTRNNVSSKWKMHLDMLDLMFSRPYYQGTCLTVSPFGGLRALWIRQRLDVSLTDNAPITGSNQPWYSSNLSNSWAIGPALGANTHWLIGCGFRFEGEAAGSILYTQYTTIANNISTPATSGVTSKTTDYNTLRAMAQLGVGAGWGSYLYCQKYYLDFAARYDFNYLWNQNVMRPFVSELAGQENDRGDLFLHGLTVTARFDF